jgi:hypothetical protein
MPNTDLISATGTWFAVSQIQVSNELLGPGLDDLVVEVDTTLTPPRFTVSVLPEIARLTYPDASPAEQSRCVAARAARDLFDDNRLCRPEIDDLGFRLADTVTAKSNSLDHFTAELRAC